jgi:hypothetical protein
MEKSHNSYVNPMINILKDMDTSDYCSILANLNLETFYNNTFCLTVDNEIVADQGYHISMTLLMSQL